MTSWDFAKYLVDIMYSHWVTTAFFIFLISDKSWLQERTITTYSKGENE